MLSISSCVFCYSINEETRETRYYHYAPVLWNNIPWYVLVFMEISSTNFFPKVYVGHGNVPKEEQIDDLSFPLSYFVSLEDENEETGEIQYLDSRFGKFSSIFLFVLCC